ncbi:hypothetical protein BN1708_000634 [Verticillium longisporum]|uniref:Uncharacterized protein n=1 Tax=Verticillium longisporum TaxID=100787 RepID=A0A0G4LXS7_VERLO|nr:hypothetical protein BN1708_000634 [Verticillium longisporum]
MSRGANVIRDLSKKLASRTIQVTVVPAPVKFPERRAVLHALQKFAKIEVFRKLDDHDASFISVASDNESASELIRRSPLEYQLATGGSKGSVRTFLTTNPSTEPILNSAADSQIDTESNIRVEGQDTQKDFKLHIFPAPDYIHSAAVRASPLHGPWTDGRRETIMSSLLKRSLPADVSADGLSDWESGGQDPDLDKSRLVEDLLFGGKSVDPHKRARAERLLRQKQKRDMPAVTEGLLHLVEQQGQETGDVTGGQKSTTTPSTT